MRRGRGGKEKEWTDCVQSDIREFGITGDWKTMALKALWGQVSSPMTARLRKRLYLDLPSDMPGKYQKKIMSVDRRKICRHPSDGSELSTY